MTPQYLVGIYSDTTSLFCTMLWCSIRLTASYPLFSLSLLSFSHDDPSFFFTAACNLVKREVGVMLEFTIQ